MSLVVKDDKFTGLEALTKTGKAGEGTYGIVYTADVEGKPNMKLAIKRNLVEVTADFNSSVSELDFLLKLKGHPYILELQGVSIGNPFSSGIMSPLKGNSQIKDDNIHFIFKEAIMNCEEFMRDKSYSSMYAKIAMFEILLGLEYAHTKGIIHRDIKPSNVLLFMEGSTPSFKLCDFGMSKVTYPTSVNTPGVVTSWYRAPEIAAAYKFYDTKSDMWSIGCLFYELVALYPLFYGVPEDNKSILDRIFHYSEEGLTKDDIKEMYPDTYNDTIDEMSDKLLSRKMDLFTSLDSSPMIKEFQPDELAKFKDLLTKLIEVDPSKRLSATEALNHPFFDWTRRYIDYVRTTHPPVPMPYPSVDILNCIERRWAMDKLIEFHNKGLKEFRNFYIPRMTFQAISLFDRYLHKDYPKGVVDTIETIHSGAFLSRKESELKMAVCIYITVKYFSTMVAIRKFGEIFPEFNSPDDMIKAEKYEIELIRDVFGYNIYQPTLYEVYHDVRNEMLSGRDIIRMLEFYIIHRTIHYNSVKDMYDEYSLM